MAQPNTIHDILAKLDKQENGCWIWTGKKEGGYGRARMAGKLFPAHRLIYEHLVGPVPPGLEIDHLCRVGLCCNPSHLEAVTHKENVLRGEGKMAKHARQTHCLRGHPLCGENLLASKQGFRRCKTCRNTLAREKRKKDTRPRTTCKHGHPWVAENLYYRPDGIFVCRTCARDRRRRCDQRREEKGRR